MSKDSFQQIWLEVENDLIFYNFAMLKQMSESLDVNTRLRALFLIRKQIEFESASQDYFSLAQRLINDEDNNCRWQALIVIGEFIETEPERIWEVIREHGESPDEDMRNGVATILLEHLLEHHFNSYFPRLKNQIEGGSLLLGDTLSRCWAYGEAEMKWPEIEALVKQVGAKNKK